MPIKSVDDESKSLVLLKDLQQSSYLDARQKKWLCDELLRFKRGIQRERVWGNDSVESRSVRNDATSKRVVRETSR